MPKDIPNQAKSAAELIWANLKSFPATGSNLTLWYAKYVGHKGLLPSLSMDLTPLGPLTVCRGKPRHTTAVRYSISETCRRGTTTKVMTVEVKLNL